MPEAPASSAPVMDEADEIALTMVLDQIISSNDDEDDDDKEQYTVVNVGGSARIVRKKNVDKNNDFAYADNDTAHQDEKAVVIPYTRAQYLALPRKKKKRVLMNVRKMIAYRNTRAMLDFLKSMNSESTSVQERIKLLEEKLVAESKFLPTAPLWEESVQRLKK